jgi:hypothetical protein
VTRPKWNLVSIRLAIRLILTQDWCTVCAEHTIGSEITLDAPGGTPRCVGHVKSHFGPFKIVLVPVQDRCIVCTKSTIAQKSFWMHPMVVLGDKARVEARFGPFGDSVSVTTR